MNRLSSNPDRDFSAGYGSASDIDRLMADPPLLLTKLDDPVVRERVGKLIGDAMRRLIKTDLHR